jgi:hypothetical protein
MLAGRLAKVIAASSRVVAACLLLLIAEGCQERPTTVSGTVTLDGRPLSVASNARGTVVFQPVGGQGTMATGLIDAAGHFSLATGGSREVAPGKYQVAVSVVQLAPKLEDAEQGTELITPAKYASAHESDLEADVAPGEENRLSFNLISNADGESLRPPQSPSSVPESNDSQPAANPAADN